ncbi:hypothetical protein [Clostridium sp. C8-1-8]|uniref:hypothetical protein n=1 Tax=Clostridium sp. C8-1-8 TaxID=2698831 RepID=UPI00136F6945|nr:hypothetical protein [Clostridium sp. C8-1-8]
MKNDVKFKFILVSLIGVLLGRIINRILFNYFGDSGSNMLFSICLVIMFIAIGILAVLKHYLLATMFLILSVPFCISGIGLYLDNMNLVGIGILLIAITVFILIKILPKFINNK